MIVTFGGGETRLCHRSVDLIMSIFIHQERMMKLLKTWSTLPIIAPQFDACAFEYHKVYCFLLTNLLLSTWKIERSAQSHTIMKQERQPMIEQRPGT